MVINMEISDINPKYLDELTDEQLMTAHDLTHGIWRDTNDDATYSDIVYAHIYTVEELNNRNMPHPFTNDGLDEKEKNLTKMYTYLSDNEDIIEEIAVLEKALSGDTAGMGAEFCPAIMVDEEECKEITGKQSSKIMLPYILNSYINKDLVLITGGNAVGRIRLINPDDVVDDDGNYCHQIELVEVYDEPINVDVSPFRRTCIIPSVKIQKGGVRDD